MTIQEILAQQNTSEIISKLKVQYSGIKVSYTDCKKQYDPLLHDVMDEILRPKKTVQTPTGNKNTNGEDILDTKLVDVARIAVPFQKILVNRTTSFLLNDGIDIQSDAETDRDNNFVELLMKIWSDNKLEYKTKQLSRIWMSECEVAELWYFTKDGGFWKKLLATLGIKDIKWRARVKILANSMGDTLYPHFNDQGDMDAFSRAYTTTLDGKAINKFEIYTEGMIYHFTESSGIWESDKGYPTVNALGKIPVIYYNREYPLWYEVQKLIDRYETLISNFADSNDYFGSPMIKVKGKVTGFATKGEQGKILEMEGESDANYLTWDQAPESIKLELETLQNLIFSLTQVPDISFAQMSKLGQMSGISRKLMFMDMHLKCFNEQETFGEMIQRRLNLMKAIIGKVTAVGFDAESENIELWPVFTPYLPSADEDMIISLSTAVGGRPIMSQKTAVKLNPYVENPEAEMEDIKSEESALNQEAVL